MHHHSSTRYLVCPRCRLSIRSSRLGPAMSTCPRCTVQAGMEIPLFRSSTPADSELGALEGPAPQGSTRTSRVGAAA
jgi:hypothetical protein